MQTGWETSVQAVARKRQDLRFSESASPLAFIHRKVNTVFINNFFEKVKEKVRGSRDRLTAKRATTYEC